VVRFRGSLRWLVGWLAGGWWLASVGSVVAGFAGGALTRQGRLSVGFADDGPGAVTLDPRATLSRLNSAGRLAPACPARHHHRTHSWVVVCAAWQRFPTSLQWLSHWCWCHFASPYPPNRPTAWFLAVTFGNSPAAPQQQPHRHQPLPAAHCFFAQRQPDGCAGSPPPVPAGPSKVIRSGSGFGCCERHVGGVERRERASGRGWCRERAFRGGRSRPDQRIQPCRPPTRSRGRPRVHSIGTHRQGDPRRSCLWIARELWMAAFSQVTVVAGRVAGAVAGFSRAAGLDVADHPVTVWRVRGQDLQHALVVDLAAQ
jgi:hypothetical protein